MAATLHCEHNKLSDDIMPMDSQVTATEDPLPKDGHHVYIFSGKRGSGKSTLMLNLLHRKSSPYYRVFHNIFLVSPTARRDPKWKDVAEEVERDGNFWPKLTEDTCQEIIDKVQAFNDDLTRPKKDKRTGKEIKSREKPRSLLILDDCLNSVPSSHMKSCINDLFTNGRHMKLTVWISTQKLNKLNTVIRANTDMISFYPTDSKKEFETLENEWAIDPARLRRLYEFACSEPNSFLHISFMGRSPRFFKKFSPIVEGSTSSSAPA